MEQNTIKLRYICKDMAGNEFVIIKSLTDFLNAGMNVHGRIQEIIAVNQWSGLCDKNGKEIYDGDPVLFEIKGLGKGPAECYYAYGCFWLRVEGEAKPFPLFEYELRNDIIIEVTTPDLCPSTSKSE